MPSATPAPVLLVGECYEPGPGLSDGRGQSVVEAMDAILGELERWSGWASHCKRRGRLG
jgi:hypothetical protein